MCEILQILHSPFNGNSQSCWRPISDACTTVCAERMMRDLNNHGRLYSFFASAKKEKRICNHFLSFILLGPLTIPLRRRIGKSDHRQARVLSPLCVFLWEKPWDFAVTFLEQKSQSSWSRKVRLQRSARRICDHTSTKMDWKIWWTSSLSECSPLSSSCAWNSGFTFLDEKSQSSWPSTMHASQFVHDSGYKSVLTIKKKCSFVFGYREHWVIAIILKSH
jgi:hypothetical protein